MKIGLLGGLRVEHEGRAIEVGGAMQLAVLFRLAVDAGTAVSYRAIAEDIWGADAPENTKAALQSIVSRLRSQLPAGVIESTVGGYRLAVGRADVDALVFADRVAAASVAGAADAARLASEALGLWAGDPWIPSENFDWFDRDLRRDHAAAIDFGGVATAPAAANPIPVPLTSLIGRDEELAMIAEQLANSRLVTVVGMGGAGKTRLAVETAASRSGALLVELAPVGADELYAAVLAATGRELRTANQPAETASTADRVIDALLGKDVLLVLDNCEHVIDDAARLAARLLTALPRLRILATSREPLGVPGEAFVTIGPLDHPNQEQLDAAGSPKGLLEFAAVQLFSERATAASGVELLDDELVTAGQITLRLDGLPLALELAAAKLRTMTIGEVLTGLEHRFALLTGGFRTALPRHQTLRAMIDWSWSLLSPNERVALARIAVFPSGIEASEAQIAARWMGLDSGAEFESLVDKSLVRRAGGRFRTLETIREYGIERLVESGDLESARTAQAEFTADRVEAHDPLLRGPQIHDAIAWFDAEQDNIAAALRFSVSAGLAEFAVRLAGGSAWYWIIRDRNEDAQQWLLAVSPLANGVEGDVAEVIAAIAPLTEVVMATPPEVDATLTAKRVFESIGDLVHLHARAGSNELLQLLSVLLATISDLEFGPDWAAALKPPRGEDFGLDPWPTAVLHVARASLAQNRGDIDELGDASENGVRMFEKLGDSWGLALAQQMRSEWLVLVGRLDEAFAMTESSTANMRRITESADLMQQQQLAVGILVRKGDLAGARARAADLVEAAIAGGGSRTLTLAASTATSLAALDGDVPEALRFASLMGDQPAEVTGQWTQLTAMQGLANADLKLLLREVDEAEVLMRGAITAAVNSHDHPVIAGVTVGLARLCAARGDLERAALALDLADAIRGAGDELEPSTIRIRAQLRKAGIDSRSTVVPDNPIPAIQALLAVESD